MDKASVVGCFGKCVTGLFCGCIVSQVTAVERHGIVKTQPLPSTHWHQHTLATDLAPVPGFGTQRQSLIERPPYYHLIVHISHRSFPNESAGHTST